MKVNFLPNDKMEMISRVNPNTTHSITVDKQEKIELFQAMKQHFEPDHISIPIDEYAELKYYKEGLREYMELECEDCYPDEHEKDWKDHLIKELKEDKRI